MGIDFNDFKMLTRELIPAWYELTWDPKAHSITVLLHKDFVDKAKVIPKDARVVQCLTDIIKPQSFVGDFKENFGFDGLFVRNGLNYDFFGYEICLPKIKIRTEKKCRECKRKRKDKNFPDDDCLYCDGTGHEVEYRWADAQKVSANLALMFAAISLEQVETSCPKPQLMTVELGLSEGGMHSAPIWGKYSQELTRWLSHFPANYRIKEMEDAMKEAYGHMLSVHEMDRFSAHLPSCNGWLNTDCPGDACGTHPGGSGHIDQGEGYDFSCHNTDNPAQQLTLLAGHAALHMKARKEMR